MLRYVVLAEPRVLFGLAMLMQLNAGTRTHVTSLAGTSRDGDRHTETLARPGRQAPLQTLRTLRYFMRAVLPEPRVLLGPAVCEAAERMNADTLDS